MIIPYYYFGTEEDRDRVKKIAIYLIQNDYHFSSLSEVDGTWREFSKTWNVECLRANNDNLKSFLIYLAHRAWLEHRSWEKP